VPSFATVGENCTRSSDLKSLTTHIHSNRQTTDNYIYYKLCWQQWSI